MHIVSMHPIDKVGMYGGDDTIHELLSLLRTRDTDIRWEAAGALSRCGEDAVEPLIRFLYDDDPSIRMLSAWALGKIGDERAVHALKRTICDDDICVCMAGEGALSRLSRK